MPHGIRYLPDLTVPAWTPSALKLTHIYTRLKALVSQPIPLQQVAKRMRMLTELPAPIVGPGLTPPQLPDKQSVNSLVLVIKE